MINTIIKLVFVIIGFAMGLMFVDYAFLRHEKNECDKWEAQMQEYPLFYYEQWQKDQCKLMES